MVLWKWKESKYTEKVHGKRLLKMLQTEKSPCSCCSAVKRFDYGLNEKKLIGIEEVSNELFD